MMLKQHRSRLALRTFLVCSLAALSLVACSADESDNNRTDRESDAGDVVQDVADGRTDDVGDTDDSTDDAPDGDDVGTECVDCADEVTCQDGEVVWSKGGGGCFPADDVPSCDNLSSGLSESYNCEEGCRLDEDYSDVLGQTTLEFGCEESRPKDVGDACEDSGDCTPSEDVALECDTSTNECVESS